MNPITSWLDMGRFEHHIETAAELLPRVTDPISIEPNQFHIATAQFRVRVRRLAAVIATTPRRDGLLLLDIGLERDAAIDDIAELLYATWRWRFDMHVGGSILLDWLAAQVSHVKTETSNPLTFGQNVHQCVFAGGKLARQLLKCNRNSEQISSGVVAIVFRGTVAAKNGSNLDIRRPPALNNPRETMVAHGRGVSLIIGWTEPVENAFGVAAAGLVNAAGVVRRVRLQSLETLRINETSAAQSAPEVRTLVALLSERLNELQLDLSFGIEIYADASLIPELLVESYHSSLRRVAALSESMANTSRIVDRVAAVMHSRYATLEASAQEYTEQRGKIFAGTVAIGSLLALPPALLLAYFGINSTNVNSNLSIFDLRHYGITYLIVWVPFIVLVVGAGIMRYRVRPRRPE